MELRKATRQQAKIRLGFSGPSGSGKTYSALLVAFGLCGNWDKIALIDTENRSADLYSDLGAFNKLDLDAPYSPERYIEAIKTCELAGMEVVIIDSISHEWEGKGGCLEIQDKLGGKYQNWAEVTPRHRNFINAILTSKCHVITTARSKTEYAMITEGNKTKVEKLGLKDITREGFDYELTSDLDLDLSHNARASKDRTGLFMDKPAFTPSVATGKTIKAWCEMGELPQSKSVEEPHKPSSLSASNPIGKPADEGLRQRISDKRKELKIDGKGFADLIKKHGATITHDAAGKANGYDATTDQLSRILAELNEAVPMEIPGV